jgi:hypothetical protein
MGGDLPGTWNHRVPRPASLNPANPDPTQNVMWGEQTWEEMMIGTIDVDFPRVADGADD